MNTDCRFVLPFSSKKAVNTDLLREILDCKQFSYIIKSYSRHKQIIQMNCWFLTSNKTIIKNKCAGNLNLAHISTNYFFSFKSNISGINNSRQCKEDGTWDLPQYGCMREAITSLKEQVLNVMFTTYFVIYLDRLIEDQIDMRSKCFEFIFHIVRKMFSNLYTLL